ncbi:MAG: flagellar filament capping protein FliD [Gammaproteobacteria bacterium]|nr:flagellar filament capping protein FliD [Gammaproteobacteria bacterium]
MPGISPTGGSSGMDVDGLVNKLVTAERLPVETRLARQEAKLQADISALGSFRGALAEFQTSVKGLRESNELHKIAAKSSNDDVVEVSANHDAQDGDYQLEVVQLARAQRLTSTVFDSDLEPMGNGKLTVQFGRFNPQTRQFESNPKSSTQTLEINDSNNSLRGIAAAINQANLGAHASIINDGNGYRLVISALASGEHNQLRIIADDADGNNNDNAGLSRFSYDLTRGDTVGQNLSETVHAKNAVIMLDGIEISSDSNEVENAIQGVTLKLKDTTNSDTVRISTRFDGSAVKESVQGFVKAFNELNTVMQSVAGVDPKTKQAGPLAGDATIRGIVDQIRRVNGSSFGGINKNLVSLASIGIDIQRDGSLTVDDSKLAKAINDNFDEVTHLFSRTGSSTDPLVKFLTANDNSTMGSYALRVSQLPTHGYYLGASSGDLDAYTLDGEKNSFIIKVDGVTSGPIVMPAKEYPDGKTIAAELTRQINGDNSLKRSGAAVTVRYVADQLVIESAKRGSQSQVDIIAADADIRGLGIDPAEGIAGTDIAGTLGNEPAEGSGNRLTGRKAAYGLQVEVLGGKTGDRGEVVFSRGVAEQLSAVLDDYLSNQGIIATRNKGYDTRIKDIGGQRDQMERHLAATQQRLLKQYSSLDALMGKMRDTSDNLANSLAKLPGTR